MQIKKAKFISGRFVQNITYVPLQKYILHTAYEYEGKYPDHLAWLDTYLDPPEFESFDKIVADAPDIVCFSMYVWSSPYMVKIAKYLRPLLPNAVFIVGGADIRHQTHDQYMQQHPWFDYVIYGAGEDAFVQLIDLLFEQRTSSLDLLNIPNLIFRNKQGEVVKTKHQVYKGKIFSELSPYIIRQDEVRKDTDYIRNVCKSEVHAAWEPDRGCPYKCSFCDWGYGLHNKVSRKKFSFEQELDLFKELDISIMITAANVGMFPEDIKYMEHIYKNKIQHQEPSWAKNHKQQVAEIWKKQIDITGELRAYVSLESINEQVLQNIDRPCMPWQDMKHLLLQFRRQGHTVNFYPEIIAGLPGETVESWDYMMLEFLEMIPLYHVRQYEWYVLPNAPAGNLEYQQRFNLDVRPTKNPNSSTHNLQDFNNKTEQEIWDMLANDSTNIYTVDMNVTWGSYSYGVMEKLYFHIAAGIIASISRKFDSNNISALKKTYQSLKPKMLAVAQRDAEKFQEYYQRYGHMTSYILDEGQIYNYIIYWSRVDAVHKLMSIKI
jgi:tRNA A37 methylthiotransferase MiaB